MKLAFVIAYAVALAALVVWGLAGRGWRPLTGTLKHTALLAGACVMMLPFYWMIVTSLKTLDESSAYPPTWWPEDAQWKNYPEAWSRPEVGFARYYWVSIYTSVLATGGTMITSVLAAYAFAKINFPGKGLFFILVLATMMVPGQVLIIPSYIILAWLKWLDTYKALVVPWLASVVSIFLMRQFFMTVPDDLYDASQIDGASRLSYVWRVLVPLSKPVLIASGIVNFTNMWNSLLWPLVVTTRAEMRTLMVGLQVFNNDTGSEYHLLMAASTFCIMPVVIGFFLLQRYFIEGIARSGLKS